MQKSVYTSGTGRVLKVLNAAGWNKFNLLVFCLPLQVCIHACVRVSKKAK